MARLRHALSSLGGLLWGGRWRRVATVFVALLLVAWIALNSWLIPRAVDHMEHALAERGLHLSYLDDPKIDLLGGRVAVREITLYRTSLKSDPIIYLSDFRVRFSLSDLISKGSFHAQGKVRDGTVIIYGKDRDTELCDLDAEIKFEPGRLQIAQFSSQSNVGCRVDLTLLARWEDVPAEIPPQEPSEISSPPISGPDFAWVEKVADVILCKTRPGTPARLDLEVNIDKITAGAVPMTVTGHLRGRELAWQNIPLQSLDATFIYANKIVSITDFQLVGQRGAATALASYDLTTTQLSVEELVSTMDPIVTLEYLDADWFTPPPGIDYDAPPKITSEKLLVDFRNPEAIEILLAIDAPDGIRYRDGSGEDDTLRLEKFRGSIGFGNPRELRFRNLEATLNGIDLSGQVTLRSRRSQRVREPGRSGPKNAKSQAADPEPRGSNIAARLNRLLTVEAPPDRRPQLELDIVLDPAKTAPAPPALQIVSGKLSGTDFEWHGKPIESAEAHFTFNDGLFGFDRVKLAGVGGQLEASGSYEIEQKILKIPKLSSSIDLAEMKNELGLELPPLIDSITFPSPPSLSMTAVEFHIGDARTGRGQLDFKAPDGLTLSDGDQTLTAKTFELAMAWSEPEILTVERAAGRIGGMEFAIGGKLQWDWSGGSAESSRPGAAPIAPAPREPAAGAKMNSPIAALKRFLTFETSGDPVKLESQFIWHAPAARPTGSKSANWAEQLELTANISAGKHRWRGYSVKTSAAKFALKDGKLAFLPLRLETTDGTIESQGHYDFAAKKLRLATLQFGLDPLVALERLGIPAKGAEKYVHFSTPPVFTGKDLLFDLADWRKSSGSLRKTNQSGFTLITPKKRKVVMENAQGELAFSQGKFEAKDFTAEVFGGDANLEITIDAPTRATSYDLDFSVSDVSLAAFNRWMSPKDPNDDAGTFNLTFRAKGSDTPGSLEGAGRATIDSEEPMAQNFLALKGLVGALEGLFPVLNQERQWKLDLPFSVDGSTISTEATKLSNRRTTAEISGQVDLAENKTALTAKVNLRGLMGVAGKLVRPLKSDFLEFYGTGSPSDIQWESGEPPEPEDESESRPSLLRENR